MAYTINLTNGTILTSVSNGTIDTTTSLTLIGKNYAGYGEFTAENFVRLLESNANATAPDAPLVGQLWYDTSLGLLRYYNGTEFKNLATATSTTDQPEDPNLGDMWFDTVNSQLNVYDGTTWILIGPAFTSGTGTSGSIVDTITDTIAVDHVVVKLFIDDEVVAIVSKDAPFTPAVPETGFASVINPGIQLAETIAGQTPIFTGTATNSELLDGVDSSGYLSSLNNDTTAGTLGVLNDNGLTVGTDGDAKLAVSGDDVTLSNITEFGDLLLQVNSGAGTATALQIDGTTKDVTLLADLTVTTDATVSNDLFVTQDATISNDLFVTNDATITQDLTVSGNVTGLTLTADINMTNASRVMLEAGSAANPSLGFRLDGVQDTGIWSSGDGNIDLTTNGVNKVNINPAGATIAGTLEAGETTIVGNLNVGTGNASYITMADVDHGARQIHCNSDRIGFLNQAAAWGSYCNDDGSWSSDVAMYAPTFNGALNGNASTATYATSAGYAPEPFVYPRNPGRGMYANYYNNRNHAIYVAIQTDHINNYYERPFVRISRSGYPTTDVYGSSYSGNASVSPFVFALVPAYSFYMLRMTDSSTRTIDSWVEWYP